ncbi:hypothetical protein C2869_12405 [Saccharobesus litoralis]|uniref:DUF2496 domain-containing protein n=1 Tax=Saccharobesus litoralis TaxID=2172099 RepID=A0A2S0VSL1_9ALTE|nr:DUF2496 domain-containing protein [Saccharobesus litoralis]AWB67187.1 hypothetical protein C2869_12405 [Saccharobesus litoralis]
MSETIEQQIASAPFHVRLAIDLIMQLEQNDVDVQEALKALEIVQADLQAKIASQQS